MNLYLTSTSTNHPQICGESPGLDASTNKQMVWQPLPWLWGALQRVGESSERRISPWGSRSSLQNLTTTGELSQLHQSMCSFSTALNERRLNCSCDDGEKPPRLCTNTTLAQETNRNLRTTPSVSTLGSDLRGGRCNKSRGNCMNNFHALVRPIWSPTSRHLSASVRANLMADLHMPRKKIGRDFITHALTMNSDSRSTSSTSIAALAAAPNERGATDTSSKPNE